jgi:hypothetical protein
MDRGHTQFAGDVELHTESCVDTRKHTDWPLFHEQAPVLIELWMG